MEYRIGISGTQGVGKSTLSTKLYTRFDLPFLTEVARRTARKKGFSCNQDILDAPLEKVMEYQYSVFYEQMIDELALAKYISDRTLFDVVSYMRFYGIEEKICDVFSYIASEHSQKYSVIFYAPIPLQQNMITDDGYRMTDVDKQLRMDGILQKELSKSLCPVISLTTDRDIWFDKAVGHILSLKY